MGNDSKKPDGRKGISGGFFILLIAAVLAIFSVQNLSSQKTAKVGFSHQTEHLVNLDLLQKDENRKIALNDNLVTFTGKFKERLTDESKNRFRFLDLLYKNHELAEKREILEKRSALCAKACESQPTGFCTSVEHYFQRRGIKLLTPSTTQQTMKMRWWLRPFPIEMYSAFEMWKSSMRP